MLLRFNTDKKFCWFRLTEKNSNQKKNNRKTKSWKLLKLKQK